LRNVKNGAKYEVAKGHLYEVDVPDEITNKMLDWDAPLSDQPEIVEKMRPLLIELIDNQNVKMGQPKFSDFLADTPVPMIDKMIASRLDNESWGAGDFAKRLWGEYGKVGATDKLREAGIPGIRYFDGSSRSAGEGTRNIVVFNPDDINTVKRDGETVFNKVTK